MNNLEELARGWRTLLGAILGIAIGVGALPFYTFGLFHTALTEEFGWSLTMLSVGSFASTMALALASPWAGALIDRYGVRGPAFASLLALAAGFAALSVLGSLPAFWAANVAIAVLGAASAPVGYTRAVNARFHNARGLALGIALTGTGLCAVVGPLYVGHLMHLWGWRGAYQGLMAAILVIAPIALLLLGPERGAKTAAAQALDEPPTPSRQTSVVLAAVFLLIPLAVSGLIVHFVPILMMGGVSRLEAAEAAALVGFAVIGARLVVGWLVDHWFAPHVAIGTLAVCCLGLLTFAIQGVEAAPFAALAIGFAVGAEVDLIGYLTARYYGLAGYGRMYGRLYGVFLAGTAVSPLWIALILDGTGGHEMAMFGVMALLVAAMAGLLLLPRFPPAQAEPA